jgi:ribosomal protein L19
MAKIMDIIIHVLSTLRNLTNESDLPNKTFIQKAYNNAINNISNTGIKSITKSEISKYKLTPNMKDKIYLILDAAAKKKKTVVINGIIIDISDNSIKSTKLIRSLEEISGIGREKALALIALGVQKISDLSKSKYLPYLSDESRAFIKYKPVLKIPRATITKISKTLLNSPDIEITIVGSYLRGKSFSKDIDVMIISKGNVINKYIQQLKAKTDIVIYSNGPSKASLLLNYQKKYYKLDIFKATPTEKITMKLYLTGSASFNMMLRNKAKLAGYTLNQRGLFKKGKLGPVPLSNDTDLFKILKLNYINPKNR